MKGCLCPPLHRTVKWPSVPAATPFPRGPKYLPTRPTKPSGASALGRRFVAPSRRSFSTASRCIAPPLFTVVSPCATVQRQLRQRDADALRQLPRQPGGCGGGVGVRPPTQATGQGSVLGGGVRTVEGAGMDGGKTSRVHLFPLIKAAAAFDDLGVLSSLAWSLRKTFTRIQTDLRPITWEGSAVD